MEYKSREYKHNTDISSIIVLNIEDELDEQLDTLSASKNYKWLCQYVPQDVLDNFLGWFGQECIERYYNETKKPIDEKELEKLAWYEAFKKYDVHSETENIIQHRDGFVEGFKAGYRKAKEE